MADTLPISADEIEALRRERDRLKRQLNFAENIGKMGSWTLDPKIYCVFLSDSLCRTWNLPGTPENRYNLAELGDMIGIPSERGRVRETVLAAVEQKSGFSFIQRFVPVGTDLPVWYRHTGEPRLDDDGGLYGFRGITQDITTEIAAREERETFHDTLQGVQRDETLGYMASVVSHEVSNYLQPALTYCTLTVEAADNEDCDGVHRHITKIEQAIKRVSDLVQSVLSMTVPSEEEALETLTLRSELRYVANFVDPSLRALLEADFTREALDTEFLATRSGIAQTMMNLLKNSAQASPKGSPIYLEAHVDHDANEYHWSVLDEGEGFSEEALTRAFDPMFTTKGRSRGTGVGLVVVQSMIERWGGRIKLSNRKNGGARVDIILQLAKAEGGDHQVSAPLVQ